MATVGTNIKIDQELKQESQALFESLGLNLSTAVNMFLRQAVLEQAIPFRVGMPSKNIPNEETLEAIKEVRRMKKDPSIGKSYTDVDEMMKELLA